MNRLESRSIFNHLIILDHQSLILSPGASTDIQACIFVEVLFEVVFEDLLDCLGSNIEICLYFASLIAGVIIHALVASAELLHLELTIKFAILANFPKSNASYRCSSKLLPDLHSCAHLQHCLLLLICDTSGFTHLFDQKAGRSDWR